MISIIGKNFGSSDLEWFCAAEAVLNTLFNTKQRNAHDYAKLFIDQIVKKMFRQREVQEVEEMRNQPADMVANTEPMPLDENLTDVHYAQLFFVVGHTAIKMLTYVEQIEAVMKQALQDSYKNKKKKRQSS